jgi:hypothetical protein
MMDLRYGEKCPRNSRRQEGTHSREDGEIQEQIVVEGPSGLFLI